MLQKIMSGITQGINAEFDSAYPVYETTPVEEQTEPYFLVNCTTFNTSRALGNRFRRKYGFHVTYFPRDGDSVTQCFQVGEKLSSALHIINIEETNLCADGEMSGTMVEGKLQFELAYSMFIMPEETTEDQMETLQQTQQVS